MLKSNSNKWQVWAYKEPINSKILTLEFKLLPKQPPYAYSAVWYPVEATGIEEVLLILGVKIFERENVLDNELEIGGFSCNTEDEPLIASSYALSMSKGAFLFLKFSFGKKSFMDDLILDEDGPGGIIFLASLGSGFGRKFTLLGAGLSIGGMFILTSST